MKTYDAYRSMAEEALREGGDVPSALDLIESRKK